MEFDGFLYETLSPISTPSPDLEYSGEPESYHVLRNHKPMFNDSTQLPETSTPELISLDDNDGRRISIKRSRLDTGEKPQTSVEAGWFRANCGFKSPMLLLHKGTFFSFIDMCYLN